MVVDGAIVTRECGISYAVVVSSCGSYKDKAKTKKE